MSYVNDMAFPPFLNNTWNSRQVMTLIVGQQSNINEITIFI